MSGFNKSRILIVGATRGLGASLVDHYSSDPQNIVHATTRSGCPSDEEEHRSMLSDNMRWIFSADLTKPNVGEVITFQVLGGPFDVIIISAGHFTTEDFSSGPNWDEELRMYTTSSIAPVTIIHALKSHIKTGTKIILISSEAGSLTLRHSSEGGGNYAHHASKAALNMVGKLLSFDLKDKGVIVSMVHPGFMRTDMTKNVGFDKYWDEGGAVTPNQAAERLVEWIGKLDMSMSGEFWAPGGAGDIGTAEVTMGKDLGTPLKLPW